MVKRRWSRPHFTIEEKIANADDDFIDLTPVSEAPAEAVRAAYDALLPGQEIPLIGEKTYVRDDERT